MVKLDDSTAYAVNWLTVLAVDALVGVLVAAIGVWLLTRGTAVLGVVLLVAGLVYVALVGRRFLRWRRLRAEAGL